MYLLNAFSLNMISTFPVDIHAERIPLEKAAELAADSQSAVGHPDTAAVFGSQLGCPVEANRVNVTLAKGDSALIGQYRGPRLAEGATTLPEGATISWLLVTVS